jgi:hypothetical protein
MRPQPLGAPVLIGEGPVPQAPVAQPGQGDARFGGGDRAERGNGARAGDGRERSEAGGRARVQSDGDERAPRARRREREG